MLLARLKEAVMTGEPEAIAALLAEDAGLEASLAEVRVQARGREEAARELARVWRGPGTLVDWQEAGFAEGAAVTAERLGEDGRLRRWRLYLRASDGRAERVFLYEARPRPGAGATPSGVPGEVLARLGPGARRAPLAHDGNSGGSLERIVLAGGRALVAKRVRPGGDWIGRATHDPGREALIARLALPEAIDTGVERVEDDPGGGWWVLMRELPLLDARSRLSRDDARAILAAAATLHRAFDAEPDAGLCSLHDRLALHAPATAAAERGGSDLVPKQLETGWACFAEAAPPDVADAVLAVLDDPAPLTRALRAAAPSRLIHGDLRDDNLGLCPAGRLALIDWGLAAWAPAPCELAWFLLHVAWRVDATREELIADFAALEGGDGLDLGLLTGLVMYGWLLGHSAVVHPDPAERAWARGELAWWSDRARPALASL